MYITRGLFKADSIIRFSLQIQNVLNFDQPRELFVRFYGTKILTHTIISTQKKTVVQTSKSKR